MSSHSRRVEQLSDAKSSDWAAKYAPDGKLAARLARFGSAVSRLAPEGGRALDFGCGTGDLAAHLASRGFQVTGIDIAKGMLDGARERFPSAATWVDLASDWTRLPFDDQSFDVVTASSVLEYVPHLDPVIRELARVLKVGGVLVATVPNLKTRERKLERVAAKVARATTRARPVFPAKIRRYLDYLELSKNRHSTAVWAAKAGLAGFFPVYEATEETGPLTLLAFRRG